ncbi:chemotaxis protein CheW [Planctomicrobium sp. SH668]|uniref:chemotaxis protein CheW n=1 Tax=Planctomicrobium sp. SH668 TaxID=3448126 RepID=UPI003F5B6D81
MSDVTGGSNPLWDRIRSSLEELQTRSESRRNNSALVAEKLAQRALAFRERVADLQGSGPVERLLTLTTNRATYGIPLDSVVEIQPLDSFSPVPGAPPFIRGVVHFRGTILSLIDLGRLFGAPDTGIADIHFYVVAQGAGKKIALAADEVDDLLSMPVDAIKAAPEWSEKTPASWIRGIYQESQIILDMNAILQDTTLENWRSK